MQKLRLTGILLLTGAAATAYAAASTLATGREERLSTLSAPAAQKKPMVISQLLTVAKTGGLTAESASRLLLEAGPAQTAAAFRWLEETEADDARLSPLQRSRLEPALIGSPAVIVGIAQDPQRTADERQYAFRVALEAIVGVGGKASAHDLTSLLKAAGVSPRAPALRSQVTSAVARIAHDPSVGSTEAIAWLSAAGPALSTSVVDGVSDAEAVMTLVGCLHSTTGAEGAILNRVAGLIQRGEPVAAEGAVLAVGPFLHSDNAFERAESSTILGLVGDRRQVEQLIGALDDSQPMVRTNALKALKNLTGMTISGDVSRWKSWHEMQERWWEDEGADLVHSLGTASRRELVGILKQVSTQRLYRREITSQLLPMLKASPADEMRVAVAALATLRDPSALSAILKLRSHQDPRVRATVEDALIAFRHSGIKASRVNVLPGH